MSLEQKVGQIIQTDIGAVVPEDLARYPLGSILAGGNGGPNGDDRATPLEWLELSRRFHAAALAPRPGRVAIPLMFGIDAVHGHANIGGAVIFPHNIGLGPAHAPAFAPPRSGACRVWCAAAARLPRRRWRLRASTGRSLRRSPCRKIFAGAAAMRASPRI